MEFLTVYLWAVYRLAVLEVTERIADTYTMTIKRKWAAVGTYGLFGATLLALLYVGIEHTFFHHEPGHSADATGSAALTCDAPSQLPTVEVSLRNNHYQPDVITVAPCQVIRITNQDQVLHEPAVGTHLDHLEVGGTDQPIGPGQSLAFQLSEPGTYLLHDHRLPTIEATIEVRN